MADKNFEVRKGLTVANDVIITSGANVGIGNTAPVHKLTVQGPVYVSGNLTIISGLIANGIMGSAGQVLASNGTALYWNTISSSIPGSNTNILFNDSGTSGASNGFIFNKTTNTALLANCFVVGDNTSPSSTMRAQFDLGSGTKYVGIQGSNAGIRIYQSSGDGAAFIQAMDATLGVSNKDLYLAGNNLVLSYNGITERLKANGVGVYITGSVSDAAANVVSQTLTDAATINWDLSGGRIGFLTISGTGRTMAAPTNMKIGTYILNVIQDGAGNKTITTWNSVFKWSAGVAPTLSTAANTRDIFSFVCDGTNLYGTFIPDVR